MSSQNNVKEGYEPGEIRERPLPKFHMAVDSEYKGKQLKLYSVMPPHMLSFWVNVAAFFTSFLSTFAAAPLISIIRQDINLTRTEASGAAIASITGTCFSRIAMGSFCDAFGPRMGHIMILSLTSAPVFLMSMVTNSTGFIIVRCCIGFSLACFVCCQFWSSIMFSPNIVGTANAFAGGWGNMGGGATQIIMPYLTTAIAHNVPEFEAWRWAFFVPGACHVIIAFLVMVAATDLPDGNYIDLKKQGVKEKANTLREMKVAFSNYRTWICMAFYGFSFGVELTVDNNLAPYIQSQFNKSLVAAGNFAAIFGLLNFFSRPGGGMVSDLFAKHYGMRGRIWWLWICMSIGATFCIVLGKSENSFGQTMAIVVVFSIFIQGTCGAVYGIVPFISRRSLGLICGAVGAGGNLGGAITQAAFFTAGSIKPYHSYLWMGVMSLLMAQLAWLLYFPMWGGMVCPAKSNVTEEDYYYADWNAEEREQGKHMQVMKFCNESKSQRGMKRIQMEAKTASVGNGAV
jgi:NNP family nitrate/nitrite transporter-like MFS transporter